MYFDGHFRSLPESAMNVKTLKLFFASAKQCLGFLFISFIS